MTAELLYTYVNPTRSRDISRAVSVLKADGVIAYPTDVNWALAYDIYSQKARDRVRHLKPTHPKFQPFSLICSSISMAAQFAAIDNVAYPYLKRALPGPFTIIAPCNRTLPRHLREHRKTIGFRVPCAPLIVAIVNELGHPLATTSVPPFDSSGTDSSSDVPIPVFGYDILDRFGHAVDLVLDLGEAKPFSETTIVSFEKGFPELVRDGEGDPSIFGIVGTHVD
jgi:tRNA threonylcarbamoyl adenosine modification protein (Sua5/YciO/YrdC/YwlC family)